MPPPTTDAIAEASMRAALALARQSLGTTSPNPAVGCVIRDSGGAVAGRGRTGRGGRPHAEAAALERAGEHARGGAAYVTLEPCAHEGVTPSCARLLAEAGVARVAYGIPDPDPRTAGRGAAMLREAGVSVEEGLLADGARRLHGGHARRVLDGRPLVTLKIASSADGRIATAAGESKWITGEAARRHAHLLRARSDAVLVGGATARADDPLLTCRLPGLAEDSPVRVVLAGADLPDPGGRLAKSAKEVPLWIVAAAGGPKADALAKAGAEVVEVAADSGGRPDPAAALGALAERGIADLLVEGGGRIAAALLAGGLVDRIAWYRADAVLGGDGVPAVGALELAKLEDGRGWRCVETRDLGEDSFRLLAHGAGAQGDGQ